MIVRMFCTPDVSPLGMFAAALARLVHSDLSLRVRLLPPPPSFVDLDSLPGPWQGYEHLFATTVGGPFVNVVASNDPDDWTRLWTTNVVNLLVTTAVRPDLDQHHIVGHGAYTAAIVPPSTTGDVYRSWHQRMQTVVLPTPWGLEHADAVRELIRKGYEYV